MSSETIVGLCTNYKLEQGKEEKPWLAVKRAAPFAACLVALPALLLLLSITRDTSKLRWTIPGSTTRQGVVATRSGEKCDMATGRWVREPCGPIYTNLTCPTIPDSKNCQRYGKDPGHLFWRWQPADGCELPRFAPERFLDAVRGKRLAFIGDSLARNQMESLLCLLSQAEAPTDVLASDNVRAWHFPAHDFTLMALTTRFFVHADPVLDADGNPTDSFDIHLDRLDDVWRSRLPELDYAVLSVGNWFFRVNYFLEEGRRVGCAGCRWSAASNLTDFGIASGVRRVLRAALDGIAGCRDCKRNLVTLLRTYTPSHFEHGSWFDGGYCNRTRPSEEGEVAVEGAVGWELRRVQREEVRRAREASGGKRFLGVMDVTKAMMMRPDGHPNWHSGKNKTSNDCLHWCLPGPVDMWNELLLQRLAEISSPAVAR